jgi:glycosyltransferase involved in cell wall biosynthesis
VADATVVIPTHNRVSMLERALRAALGQQGVDHQVVVVDDGSSDGTAELLGELVRDEPRLTVIRHETPRGVARARNAGIARAEGAWTAFLDDDDLWSPRRLRAHLDAASSGTVLVYGAYVALDASLRAIRVVVAPSPEELDRRLLRTNPVGGPSTFTARTAVLRELGGFDESLAALADWDLLIRARQQGRLARSSEPLVGYVEHGENMMLTQADRVGAEFERLAAKHRPLAAAQGLEFGDAWLLAWQAQLARRSGGRRRAAALYARRALRTGRPKDAAKAIAALIGEPALQAARRAGRLRVSRVGWLDAYR